jgi:hypothetical protein
MGARRRLPESGRDIKDLEHELLHRNSSALVRLVAISVRSTALEFLKGTAMRQGTAGAGGRRFTQPGGNHETRAGAYRPPPSHPRRQV